MSRETQLAVCSLKFCIEDSNIRINDTYDENEISLFSGTGSSGIDLDEIRTMLDNSYENGDFDPVKFGEVGLGRLNPLISFKILPNMPPSVAVIHNGIKGRNLIFNPWEGSALLAFQEAFYEIKSGRENVVYCGGSDNKTHSDAFLNFSEYGLLNNGGIILGEGSSHLCLENPEKANERNAEIYCMVKGLSNISYSNNNVNYNVTGDLVNNLFEESLRASEIKPSVIDLIIDSNDGNTKNDNIENQVYEKMFPSIPRVSPKKIIGNTFAAAGFINLAIGSFLLKNDLKIYGRKLNTIMINSFPIGSENFSIILEKYFTQSTEAQRKI